MVLPAYNEAKTLADTVQTTLETLESFLTPGEFEVIIAEDGCDDRTPAIAEQLASNDARVRHVHSASRRGRGNALERAFREATGQTLVYFDTDLATDMAHLEELVESVRRDEYDIATGSRWMPGQDVDRPMTRSVASRGYNTLVRLVLGSQLRDHQCGFKAFDRSALFDILESVENEHWFWDTEVLVYAQRNGYRIREFPVSWEPTGESTVNIARDVFEMGSEIGRMWWRVIITPRLTRRVSVGAGVVLSLLALALMTLYLDPSVVLQRLKQVDPLALGIASIVYIGSWPLRGLRYRDILDRLGYHERIGFLTGAVFISQTGNLVVPARVGDALRAYVVNARRGIPYASGFASLVVERVFDLSTITILAGTVLLGLGASGGTSDLLTAIGTADRAGQMALLVATAVGAGSILAVATIGLLTQRNRDPIATAADRADNDSFPARLIDILNRVLADLQRGAGSREALVRIGIVSLLIWVLDIVTAVVLLAALTDAVGIGSLLGIGVLAVSVGNLAKVLPLSPGGIGLYEAAFTLIVVSLTPITAPIAFGAAVLDHAVKNVVTIGGGSVSLLVLNVSLTTAIDESSNAPRSAVSQD